METQNISYQVKKKTTFWTTVGALLLVTGGISTIAIAASSISVYGLIIPGTAVIAGVLIIAWAMSD